MVLLLTCTYNRHTGIERIVRFYLDQIYNGDSLLFIYNNSPFEQVLNPEMEHVKGKTIVVVNNHIDLVTGKPYTNVGDIHRDALQDALRFCAPDYCNFFEDDNHYLKNHIACGVAGIRKAIHNGSDGYKPQYSYMHNETGLFLQSNIFEPSIFVTLSHLQKYGFKSTAVDFHWGWLAPLHEQNKILIDKDGTPTMVYNWHREGGNLSDIKSNGTPAMNVHRNRTLDIGDQVITPISKQDAQEIYDYIEPPATILSKLTRVLKKIAG